MNSILQFMQSDLLARLGMTLIHSLWQLLLLAVLFRIFLFTVSNQAAKPRYWGAILFLFAAMVIPATTFLVLPGRLADVHQHRPLASLVRIFRLKSLGLANVDEKLVELVASLASRLRLGRSVEIARSTIVLVPTVVGFFKPLILLPASSLSGLTAQELEAILLHELAHLKRWDDVFVLLQSLAETLLFFHPAVWWFSSIANHERENCCDDLAAETIGSKSALASALLFLARTGNHQPAHSLAATGGSVIYRVRRLATTTTKPKPNASRGLSGLMALGLVGVFAFYASAMSSSNSTQPTEPATLIQPRISTLPSNGVIVKIAGKSVFAQVSPDGKRIVYANRAGDVFVALRDGTNRRQLTKTRRNSYPCWSLDGKRIVFSSRRNRLSQIYEMDADGNNVKQLTSAPFGARRPVISSQGWMSYEEMHHQQGKTWSSDLILTKGSERIKVINTEYISDHRWSNDGKKICIGTAAKINFYDLTTRTMTTIKISDKDERLYSHTLTDITWSPDNSMVAARISFLGGRTIMLGATQEDMYVIGDKEVFVIGIDGSFEMIEEKDLPKRKESWIKNRFLIAKPMNKKIIESWQRIQSARLGKMESPSAMNPPATEDMIHRLASVLGYEIPNQLRSSLLTYNGSAKWGLEIEHGESVSQAFAALSVTAIEKQWRSDRQQQREAKNEGDDFPKKPEWIPVFIDPAEGEEQVYLDTTNGSILQYHMAANPEVDPFRYPDYQTFLAVLENHIRQNLWFEWGNGTDAKPDERIRTLMLDDLGIEQLRTSDKQNVSVTMSDGSVIAINANEANAFVNSVLDALKPVKFTRWPAVQKPEYELEFSIDSKIHRIALRQAEVHPEYFDYSISGHNFQNTGGDSERLKQLMNSIKK